MVVSLVSVFVLSVVVVVDFAVLFFLLILTLPKVISEKEILQMTAFLECVVL